MAERRALERKVQVTMLVTLRSSKRSSMPQVQRAILEVMQCASHALKERLKTDFDITLTTQVAIAPLVQRGRSWQVEPAKAASTEKP